MYVGLQKNTVLEQNKKKKHWAGANFLLDLLRKKFYVHLNICSLCTIFQCYFLRRVCCVDFLDLFVLMCFDSLRICGPDLKNYAVAFLWLRIYLP